MTRGGLNLAGRPFVNRRPVHRLALLLWLLGAGLLVVNVLLYWRHFSGRGEKRQELAELEETIRAESDTLRDLRERLLGLELESQNDEIEFLNAKIAERSFPWSALFDRLAEVLPATVRLQRVSPRIGLSGARGKRVQRRLDGEEAIHLSLGGTARSSEAILELVDKLFEHPSFVAPNLASEAKREDSTIDFSLSVVYLPRRGGTAAAEEVAGGDERGEEAGEEAEQAPPPAPESQAVTG